MNTLNIFYEHIFEAAGQTGRSVEDCLKAAKSYGIDGLECDLWRLSEREQAKALFGRCGMRVASVYNMFDFPNDPRGVSERKIRECLETAAFFGADRVLAIPGFVGEGQDSAAVCEKMCGLLNQMTEQAGKLGITVTLEDFDDKAAPYSTAAGLEYFMQNVNGLGVTFDTGNFAYCGEDVMQAYSRLRGYIRHVHLKDRSHDASRGNGKNGKAALSGEIMYPCEVGGGFIGVKALLKQLIADGYSGSLSIEHFGAVDQLGYMKKSAENIREMLGLEGEK